MGPSLGAAVGLVYCGSRNNRYLHTKWFALCHCRKYDASTAVIFLSYETLASYLGYPRTPVGVGRRGSVAGFVASAS